MQPRQPMAQGRKVRGSIQCGDWVDAPLPFPPILDSTFVCWLRTVRSASQHRAGGGEVLGTTTGDVKRACGIAYRMVARISLSRVGLAEKRVAWAEEFGVEFGVLDLGCPDRVRQASNFDLTSGPDPEVAIDWCRASHDNGGGREATIGPSHAQVAAGT